MDRAAFETQLREITAGLDEIKLAAFVKSLQPHNIEQYKTELANAWLELFSVWYFDFTCGKVIMEEGPDPFFSSLLDMLTAAEEINPSRIYYEGKADCYQALAELKSNQDEQLSYIEKAAQQVLKALEDQPDSFELNSKLVNILLDKIKINHQFTDDEFTIVLAYFERALSNYTSPFHLTLIYDSFSILGLPFPKSQYWHTVFIEKLASVLHPSAEKDPFIYLQWSNELTRIADRKYDYISSVCRQEITTQVITLLSALVNIETGNAEELNQLGTAFSKAASQLNDGALPYYEVALKYFMKGQDINPATWTFPVYATNVLKAMAVIYHGQQDQSKVIELFEKGKTIFSGMSEHELDYTINIYWGELLIEYARLAYNFNAPDIFKEAEEKLLLAKELGQGYYAGPYYGLAKLALKSGDRDKCLAILKECKTVFSEAYYQFPLDQVLADEDFKEIRTEILMMKGREE
ncbi:hypothetical protein [Chitinophaga tropicalis]|uniref:Uncharacterized protein n=1 Tax=Chitinophaga tropicalis TaxID=2683588 RepID=A0A7K1UAD6_9BACT|nr:hypothetical protein [Chitinophaga tropicalis]MVT11332.1 hypothetical protein [Chitinophaga tropicalis]